MLLKGNILSMKGFWQMRGDVSLGRTDCFHTGLAVHAGACQAERSKQEFGRRGEALTPFHRLI